MKYKYKLHGLNFESEFEISGLEITENKPDVLIKLGNLPDDLGDESVKKPASSFLKDSYLLNLKNVIKILVEHGNCITVQKYPDTSDSVLKLFLLGQGIGALLHQRGSILLHANAIEYKGESILFAGDTGTGKSTISAEFVNRGFKIICDDICVLLPDNQGHFLLQTGLNELKLWQDSLSYLNNFNYDKEQIRPEMEKFRIFTNNKNLENEFKIKRIYNLQINQLKPLEIHEINLLQKINIFKNITYRKNLIKLIGDEVKHFHNVTNLAKDISLKIITRQKDKVDPKFIADFILKDLENVG